MGMVKVGVIAGLLSLTVARSLANASPPEAMRVTTAAWAAPSTVHSAKKDAPAGAEAASDNEPTCGALATLDETHSGEHLAFTCDAPSAERFSELLRDRTVGEARDLDPRLLELLRKLVAKYEGARIELVSGFRSAKRNEMMRKKGHHVASHSQHSLGHAVDFRIVPRGADKGVDPRVLEKDIRALGWAGGTGTYLLATDWFVHADVGAQRRWGG